MVARYVDPLPPDFPGVRVEYVALKPREHAVPELVIGQNTFLTCRDFLICDEKTMHRINRGMNNDAQRRFQSVRKLSGVSSIVVWRAEACMPTIS